MLALVVGLVGTRYDETSSRTPSGTRVVENLIAAGLGRHEGKPNAFSSHWSPEFVRSVTRICDYFETAFSSARTWSMWSELKVTHAAVAMSTACRPAIAIARSTGGRPSGAAVGHRLDPGTSPAVAKSAPTAAGGPPYAPGSTPPLLVVPRQNG